MAALDVAKGGSTDDDDGRVATWWRPAEPCTCRSFAAACSAGGSGGLTRLEAACGTLELQDERRSNVVMASSPSACVRMEAETRSVLRVPACAPGPAPAVWATQVDYVVHPGCLTAVMAAPECHPAIRTGWGGGGPTSGGGPLSIMNIFFRADFCAGPSTTGRPPTMGPSQSCVIG